MSTINQPTGSPGPTAGARVLITGTGRAGTTLLVQILTDLGLDTGFAPDAPIDERARAGLERALDDPHGPRIVKNPTVIGRLRGLLDSGTVRLEHVIVPMRDLDVAAASRVRATRYGTDLSTWGGLVGTLRATRQREALALMHYELVAILADYEIPHSLLAFPRFATDWEYTHRVLSFLDPAIPADRWKEAIAGRVQPELIHEAPLDARERTLTRTGTAYYHVVVRPLRAVRKAVRRDPGPDQPAD
ncbi:MAG: hypothetical protein ACXV8Y_00715 [Acidimicrobiia bacterium]